MLQVCQIKKISQLFIIGAMALLLAACAFQPSDIRLDPIPFAPVAHLGQQRAVSVAVYDVRPLSDTTIEPYSMGTISQVKLDNDIQDVLRLSLENWLQAYDFFVVAEGQGAPLRATVRVTEFNMEQVSQVVSIVLSGVLALEITLQNGPDIMTRTFRSRDTKRVPVVYDGKPIEQFVQELFKNTVESMTSDDVLIQFLAPSNASYNDI